MSYVATSLSPAEQAAVPTPNYAPLTFDELEMAMQLPSGQRPRTYGFVEPLEGEAHGQIVTIRSTYDLERYADRLSFAWLSNSSIRDLISRSR